MFLERIRRRNPALIRTSIELHQAGEIPANTFVFDVDTFESNACALRAEATRLGLHLYFMSKQHGRNPELFRRIVAPGAKEIVVVNMEDARILHRHGIGIGHIGNLVQTPRTELPKVILTYRPEVMSVFTVQKAIQISDVASAYNARQPILLRVHSREDEIWPGMEGGFYLDELPAAAEAIQRLEGVEIVGVTTFPVLRYHVGGTKPIPTPNLDALTAAKDLLQSMGITITQVNAPGNTACNTMEFLAQHGATHVEPGSSLTGSTTFHLYSDELAEQPAMVYVTEVAHMWNGQAHVFGGGFFIDDPPVPEREHFQRRALVGSDPDEAMQQEALWLGVGPRGGGEFAAIDYHGILDPNGESVAVGDTVVFGFRSQLFMTRAYSAVVEGLRSHRPRLVGVWDWAGHRVGGGLE